LAEQVVDEAYGYQYGPVLFKPTLANGKQTFRTNREGALAYFVGGDAAYPKDTGFALKGWRKVEIKNSAIFLEGNTGTTQGNVYITNKDGQVTVVDKTWKFYKGVDGKLRIILHHSSLPYTPPPKFPTASVTYAELLAAQKGWGDALVKIAKAYDEQGHAAAKALAEQVVDEAYGYQYGPVLFKPTLAHGKQTFRTTREGALAYFVGGDAAFPNDTGFALKGWRKVQIDNAAIFRDGNTGTTTGNVILTDKDGKVTVVDKTWKFFKAPDGKVRIMAHHSSLPYVPPSNFPVSGVTEAEVLAAQKGWGDALVQISTIFDEQGQEAAKALAEQVIDAAYGYQLGPVLFKPTLASGEQTFRTTREGALAYFVGGNPAYPGDTGFALKGWRKVEVKNAAIFREGNTAASVGHVRFTDKAGNVTLVDKSWSFNKGSDGQLRIVAHHSSLPYAPPVAAVPQMSEDEVLAAQQGWGDALVKIATTYEEQGHAAAKALAEQVLDEAYAYQYAPVLFKPTLASGEQTFRTTREGALAYFVGGNPSYPSDTGFALKGWRKVEVQNAAVFREGRTGTSLAKVLFTDKDGKVTAVDKTWSFYKAPDGKVRIVAHHSSLPYVPAGESSTSIAEEELLAAQRGWGDALVQISTTYDEQGHAAAKALAEQVIDAAYGYQLGPVLFKPTLASGEQTFRTTREGALAYFVGGNPAYPSDTGFALKGWRKVEIENAATFRNGSLGTTTGNVIFTDKNGAVTVVDKTWHFLKGVDGKLRIVGHHSSLPYSPPKVAAPSVSAEQRVPA